MLKFRKFLNTIMEFLDKHPWLMRIYTIITIFTITYVVVVLCIGRCLIIAAKGFYEEATDLVRGLIPFYRDVWGAFKAGRRV